MKNENKPTNLDQAEKIITDLTTKLGLAEKERDENNHKWQESNEKYQKLLKNQDNPPLTEEVIITEAKKLGMKTNEEYQQALNKDSSEPTPQDYSWLWGVGVLVIFLLGLGWLKSRSKNS